MKQNFFRKNQGATYQPVGVMLLMVNFIVAVIIYRLPILEFISSLF